MKIVLDTPLDVNVSANFHLKQGLDIAECHNQQQISKCVLGCK